MLSSSVMPVGTANFGHTINFPKFKQSKNYKYDKYDIYGFLIRSKWKNCSGSSKQFNLIHKWRPTAITMWHVRNFTVISVCLTTSASLWDCSCKTMTPLSNTWNLKHSAPRVRGVATSRMCVFVSSCTCQTYRGMRGRTEGWMNQTFVDCTCALYLTSRPSPFITEQALTRSSGDSSYKIHTARMQYETP